MAEMISVSDTQTECIAVPITQTRLLLALYRRGTDVPGLMAQSLDTVMALFYIHHQIIANEKST